MIISCNHNDQKEIEITINKVYNKHAPYSNAALNTNVYSQQLNRLLEESRRITDFEIKEIEKSKSPTDKPSRIIEGDIFSSLYEGPTSYTILHIKQRDNSAKVIIEFKNRHYKLKWKDTISVINEGGWKIDNVLYGDKTVYNKNLKENLFYFINHSQ